jgi:hypothetical protein
LWNWKWQFAFAAIVLDEWRGFFKTPRRYKDLNPGQGKESPLSVFSSPLSDLQSQGQLPRERKEMSMYSPSQLKQATLLFFIVLERLAVLPLKAVVPLPDGGYANFTPAEGTKALQNLTSGVGNTTTGWYSLFTNSSGGYSIAVGAGTLALNNVDQNTATGVAALLLNTTGAFNTANGALALLSNITGGQNTAVGPARFPTTQPAVLTRPIAFMDFLVMPTAPVTQR